MRRLCSTKNQTREQWLSVRKSGIGGSEIGAIVGLSNFGSPITVYLDKVSNAIREQNEAMRHGVGLEQYVVDCFLEDMNDPDSELSLKYCPVPGKWKAKKEPWIFQHDTEDWMLANLDRVLILPDKSKAILECKTASAFGAKYWDNDCVPEGYWCQVQWYMGITGIHRSFVAALIGGQRFIIREVLFDEASFKVLQAKGRAFWDLVECGTPPAMDGSDDASDLLQALYPNPLDQVVQLPGMALQLMLQYKESKAAEEAAKTSADFAKQHLCNLLGEAGTTGMVEDWKFTWKPQDRNNFDTKGFRKDHPHLADAYTKTFTSRVFRLSEPPTEK